MYYFSEERFVSLYLCRLRDLKPVWARLTALIVRDVSEQMKSSGKRTPVPYVNAEYVHDINQYAVQMVYTAHKHMHKVPNALIFHTLRSWSCLAVYQNNFCVPLSLCLALFQVFLLLHHLLAVPFSWHIISPQCATGTSLPFIFYLWHFLSASCWQR